MASELKVNKISPESGLTLTLGDSGDTINFGSGVLPNFENLTVTGDLTVDTNSLKVDSTNNFVGIGTATPSVALDVVGAITATGNITGTLATAAQPNITSLGTLTGLTTTGNIDLGDNDRLRLGASQDLQIYHDGSNSHIVDSGTGNLSIQGDQYVILRGASGEYLSGSNGAAVSIKYNGAEKLATSSTGITVTGTASASGAFLNTVNNSQLTFGGGNATNVGANLTMYGGNAPSDAGDFRFRNGTTFISKITAAGQHLAYPLGPTTPSFSFTNDTNTGMTRPTTDTLTLVTNSSERVRINSSGNVGIGTSSPRVKLDLGSNGVSHARWGTWSELGEESSHNSLIIGNNIYVDGSTSKVRSTTVNGYRAIKMKYSTGITFHTVNASVTADDALNYERMRIDASGNVGIGTSSPSQKLHVAGSQIISSPGSSVYLYIDSTSNYIGRDSTTGNMEFGVNGSDRMIINSSGNVGIGTTSPSTKLDVNGTVTATTFSGGGLGKVLQVLQGQNATQISTTTHNSNFDITSISITPTSTSSKILILGVVMGMQGNNNSSNTRFDAKIFRGTTALNSSGANFWTFNTDYWREGGFAIHWLDSPSTTSATTYYLKGAWLDPNGGTCYVNKDGNSGYSTITVMEIAS